MVDHKIYTSSDQDPPEGYEWNEQCSGFVRKEKQSDEEIASERALYLIDNGYRNDLSVEELTEIILAKLIEDKKDDKGRQGMG